MINLLQKSLSSVYGLSVLETKDNYTVFRKSEYNNSRRKLEDMVVNGLRLPIVGRAWCGVCRKWSDVKFSAMHSEVLGDGAISFAFSETAVCSVCLCNSRMRASADFMRCLSSTQTSPHLYLTEKSTYFYKALEKTYPNMVGSEFLPDIGFGNCNSSGVRSENIEKSTFDDNSFSMVGSFDVFEHVPNPLIALKEIHRILRSTGYAVLTFPFAASQEKTHCRATMTEGNINFLAPAIYHGNPISGNGSLVFNDIGWDFINAAKQIFSKVTVFHYSSFLGWHFGDSRFIIIAQK
jgi:hypothetical protein